ncbi:family 10 glycosylhydrolase [Neolewinella lacunae]|uniref:Family 10 glycosylhydrolase n=1 Tax=Neolewinella lacunae TaxID=1517758 RepID=A0A923T967_9BACT|nr:family 10 glycosylhydrolase [Neolewinella lacunae]MBC6996400.1 family 10 glycosylhydrolase [Neolewinella lacunae]MDN3633657.1 family 10 glycosylhydrolase [Neolewinella lacunae]
MEDKSRSLALLLILLLGTCVSAQHAIISGENAPERELRGVWMATVLNIDYPQNPTTDAATLQADFRSQLYRLRQAGMNAIFVQVRPAADALYPSVHAPWSEWLTGVQGRAPVSNFDPLAYMIETAHAQGIELHAWINPYRVAMTLDSTRFAANHLYHRHRDWIRSYGGRRYLDPGLPAVRAHLGEVIDELITKYDLDGIHFDDYFYPYPVPGVDFPDQQTYRTYGYGRSLADWRRDNVNTFIAETHRRIKAAKPWMYFGVSPFGVWRNQAQDPVNGSPTNAGATSYDGLYGDALAWARAGTVDYLLPQIYWSMDHPAASYRTLVSWWTTHVPPGPDLYIGHAAYKAGTDPDPAWTGTEELPRQVAHLRQLPRPKGSVFFSSKSLLNNPAGLAQRLTQLYTTPALLPARRAPGSATPVAVRVFKPKATEQGTLLVWEMDEQIPKAQLPHYFAIYRSRPGQTATLLHRTPYGQACYRYHYFDDRAQTGMEYQYRVVPLDRYHRSLETVVAR